MNSNPRIYQIVAADSRGIERLQPLLTYDEAVEYCDTLSKGSSRHFAIVHATIGARVIGWLDFDADVTPPWLTWIGRLAFTVGTVAILYVLLSLLFAIEVP